MFSVAFVALTCITFEFLSVCIAWYDGHDILRRHDGSP